MYTHIKKQHNSYSTGNERRVQKERVKNTNKGNEILRGPKWKLNSASQKKLRIYNAPWWLTEKKTLGKRHSRKGSAFKQAWQRVNEMNGLGNEEKIAGFPKRHWQHGGHNFRLATWLETRANRGHRTDTRDDIRSGRRKETKTLRSALRDAGIERPRLLQVADDAHSQAGRQRRVALFISTLLPLRRNLPPSSGCQSPFTHTRRKTSKTLNHCMHTHARQFRRIYSFSQFIPPDNNNLRSSK